MPETTVADLDKVLDLLLHELRTPIGVAQGYLRLLVEDRLAEARDRQRALEQSLEALGRVGRLCTSAGDFLHSAPPELVVYQAAELVEALREESQGKEFAVVTASPVSGLIRSVTPARAAEAIAAILHAALRAHPAAGRTVHIGVHGTDLLLTTGDEAAREGLAAPTGRSPFAAWRGGTGLLVPLALKLLLPTGLRVWTLSEGSGAVAIAMPIESPA